MSKTTTRISTCLNAVRDNDRVAFGDSFDDLPHIRCAIMAVQVLTILRLDGKEGEDVRFCSMLADLERSLNK